MFKAATTFTEQSYAEKANGDIKLSVNLSHAKTISVH